ncbi:hypothetical protein D3C78_674520 [compost metagenome]
MFAEHALQAFDRYGSEPASGEFGQAIEVQQLALREQHHEGADGVIEQHRLNLALGVEARAIEDFGIADVEFAKQQPDNRRGVRGFRSESDFSHGLYPFFLQFQEYNQLGQAIGSLN